MSNTTTIHRTSANILKLGREVTSATIRCNGESTESYPVKALRGRLMHEIHRHKASQRADYYREQNGDVTMIVNGNLTITMSFD